MWTRKLHKQLERIYDTGEGVRRSQHKTHESEDFEDGAKTVAFWIDINTLAWTR